MTNEEKIVDRVRKLLELGRSDNVNEAGNAAHQAQLLMSKHNISEAMIAVEAADEETEEPIDAELLHRHSASTMPAWKNYLSFVMADVNQCCTTIRGNMLTIIGRPSDATTVRYLFAYVSKEIDRLTKEEAALRGSPGRTWCNNFRLGAVQTVNQRLREAAEEARSAMKKDAYEGDDMGTGTALVVVNNALAKIDERARLAGRWQHGLTGGRKHRTAAVLGDREGRMAGRKAGESIDLGNSSREALGSGRKKALNG